MFASLSLPPLLRTRADTTWQAIGIHRSRSVLARTLTCTPAVGFVPRTFLENPRVPDAGYTTEPAPLG